MAKKQRKKEEWENNMVETKTIADRIVDVIVYLCVAAGTHRARGNRLFF